jgi:hypothetical protein
LSGRRVDQITMKSLSVAWLLSVAIRIAPPAPPPFTS